MKKITIAVAAVVFLFATVVYAGVHSTQADAYFDKKCSKDKVPDVVAALCELRDRIDDIELLPGPEGPQGEPGETPDLTDVLTRLNALEALHATPPCSPIVIDNFNTYSDGSIVGQGDWASYVNGANFDVQGTTVFEGAKALHVDTLADSVINKAGTPLSDGCQTVYVRTENRSSWGFYEDGNAQIRMLKGIWGGSELRSHAAVSFKSDGNVAYHDPVTDDYLNFDTYNDNEWTQVDFEWRLSDAKVRFRVNSGTWTDWKPISGSGIFTDFDQVGFDFFLPSGSGGLYVDTLQE